MGLTHFIGLKWIVWKTNPQPEIPPSVMKDMMEFILHGLQP
jgi:hypothetical protein